MIIGNNDYLNRFLSNQLYMTKEKKQLDFRHINIIISEYSSFFENKLFCFTNNKLIISVQFFNVIQTMKTF